LGKKHCHVESAHDDVLDPGGQHFPSLQQSWLLMYGSDQQRTSNIMVAFLRVRYVASPGVGDVGA
jgi:hypothetical protein